MRKRGLTEEHIRAILVDNPKSVLTFKVTPCALLGAIATPPSRCELLAVDKPGRAQRTNVDLRGGAGDYVRQSLADGRTQLEAMSAARKTGVVPVHIGLRAYQRVPVIGDGVYRCPSLHVLRVS